VTFSNRGRILPASGPEGHTHSIYQLSDIGASGTDGDTLVLKNGVWVATNALPYTIAAGQITCGAMTIAGGGNSGAINVNFANTFGINSKFSTGPIITVSFGNILTGSASLVPRVNTVNSGAFNIYIYNASATSTTVASGLLVNWHAIQILPTDTTGMVSNNPEE
jgi:hypothetical protein